MVSKNFFFFLILILLFPQQIKAGSQDNVFGWAWAGGHQINGVATSAIGWISFNNCSSSAECSGINYGVRISTSTGYFSGYFWSGGGRDIALATNTPVLGWISFNRDPAWILPDNYDPCAGNCLARLEEGWQEKLGRENVYIKGWARVLSATDTITTGGWDGWIRLDYATTNYSYEVYIAPDGHFHGWAWSDAPLGAISFNSTDAGAGGTDYAVFLDLSDFDNPPRAENLKDEVQYCNVFKGQAMVSLQWTYFDDSLLSSSQQAYSIIVEQETSPGFWEEKIRCENILTPSGPSSGQQGNSLFYIYRDPPTDLNCSLRLRIDYGRKIRWQVQVFDQHDQASVWSGWKEINPASHAYPWPSFSWTPQRPIVDQIVQFNDLSTCFNNEMGEISCTGWLWTFQEGNPASSHQQNPTTTFSSPGAKRVDLSASDAIGTCSTFREINTTYPLPHWKENPPTSWFNLKKLIATIFSFNLFK